MVLSNISEESGKMLSDYVNNLKGEADTSVTLTIRRGEGENQKIFDASITRKMVTIKGNGREWRTAVSQVWTRADGKWLRLHGHETHITNDQSAYGGSLE